MEEINKASESVRAKPKEKTLFSPNRISGMGDIKKIMGEYSNRINFYYNSEELPRVDHSHVVSFMDPENTPPENLDWVRENYEKFLMDTQNQILCESCYLSEMGYVSALEFSPNGDHIVVAHSTGLIQIRDGFNGNTLLTIRPIQFPAMPIYSLRYSRTEYGVCYACSTNGRIYRLEIPDFGEDRDLPRNINSKYDHLKVQFYDEGSIEYEHAKIFLTVRTSPLAFGINANENDLAIASADSSIKIFDMNLRKSYITYKVCKSRVEGLPEGLQRMHQSAVPALRYHPDDPNIFATGSWDKTARIWDTRVKVGCVMTFKGIMVCGDSVDLCRNLLVTGGCQPVEAVALWDLAAHRRLHTVRVQNRRPDVDGEYIYACQFWKSNIFNRKGKYAIVGGAGTKSVEVINLHNRYISCSYPYFGTVQAIASHQERIAFGGTYPSFNIVTFRDPKHEDLPEEKVDVGDWAKMNEYEETDNPVDDYLDIKVDGGEAGKAWLKITEAADEAFDENYNLEG